MVEAKTVPKCFSSAVRGGVVDVMVVEDVAAGEA